jgi:hypothetical protein
MAFTNAARNAALDAIGAAGAFISFHTGDTGANGANEIAAQVYSRQQTGWSPASSGSKVGTAVTSTIPASTVVTWWGLWSALTGGTFLYGGQLPAPESYGAQGTIVFTPTLTATG